MTTPSPTQAETLAQPERIVDVLMTEFWIGDHRLICVSGPVTGLAIGSVLMVDGRQYTITASALVANDQGAHVIYSAA